MDTEAIGALADRRVLEAETGRAALRVVGVQVEVTWFTPDGDKTCDEKCFSVTGNQRLGEGGTCRS